MTDRVRMRAKSGAFWGGSGTFLVLIWRAVVALEGIHTELGSYSKDHQAIRSGVKNLQGLPTEVATIKTILQERK